MTATTTSHAQPDNLLGICHRVGMDLGIDPLWLRLGFAVALIFAPVLVIASYLALGVVVFAGRLLFRDRVTAEVVRLPEPTTQAEPLPLAA